MAPCASPRFRPSSARGPSLLRALQHISSRSRIADPPPLTHVLQLAKALRRRESLGHLPLVIPWSVSALSRHASCHHNITPSLFTELTRTALAAQDRRSSSSRSRLRG